MFSSRRKQVKCVVVGDSTVGKTSMMSTYLRKRFPSDYTPTVLDQDSEDLTIRGVDIHLELWDTAGNEDYDRLRPLAYPKTNVIIMCFSVARRDSFVNIRDVWSPEVAHFCKDVPVILAGNKIDLRNDLLTSESEVVPVTKEEGEQMCKDIKAVKYMECSAKTQDGLREVFRTATEVAVFPELYQLSQRRRRLRCSLL